MKTISVINFGHPLSQEARHELLVRTGGDELMEEGVRVSVLFAKPMRPQAADILSRVKTPILGDEDIYIVLPGVVEVAAYLLAMIHAISGRFPIIVPLRRARPGSSVYVLAKEGPVDLDVVRMEERGRRPGYMRKYSLKGGPENDGDRTGKAAGDSGSTDRGNGQDATDVASEHRDPEGVGQE